MGGQRRPESVLVLVYSRGRSDREPEVLLMERQDRPGFWQSVTGSLEPGESPADAAKRELMEETGIHAVPESLGRAREFEIFPEFRHRFPPGVTHNLEHAFAVELPAGTRVRLNREEHRCCRWLPWREAAASTRSWTNRAAIEELFAGEEP